MPSRERRILDKDKEIRKLKKTAGHYFTCTINGAIENEKLKQENIILKRQLAIAINKLELMKSHFGQAKQGPWVEIASIVEIILDEIRGIK